MIRNNRSDKKNNEERESFELEFLREHFLVHRFTFEREREIYIERVLIKIMRVFDCIKNRERVMRCENLVKYHREMCVKDRRIIRASFFLVCCRFLVFYVMFFAMHKHTWSSRYSLRTIPWLFEASRNLYHAISNVGFSIRIQFTLNIVVYYHCRSTRV